jgi:hypothetical protein
MPERTLEQMRTDPQPYDKLIWGGVCHTITCRWPGWVQYVTGMVENSCSLNQFRAWTKDATVEGKDEA